MERFDYPRMVREALRAVVRDSLAEVAEHGLEGDHHFYLGFRTAAEGVDIPPFLRDLYPERMTIVLQQQFWDLEAGADAFSVTLAFGGRRHRLTVPYAAVETFADPGAEFGLQLAPPPPETAAEPGTPKGPTAAPATITEAAEPEAQPPDAGVVRLDEFRKKKT